MRASQYHIPTLRQAPADADVPSHKLLLRGGFIRPVSAGIFTFLPLGLRVLRKVENVVRKEMDRAGAIEILMPALNPRELWEKTGRWEGFGPVLFRLQDRAERWFALGPTHEEIVTDLVARDVSSYRQLPLNLYQITVKFRDEPRPRAGLIRVREFIMKDAYSFHTTAESLEETYQAMYEAYARIFRRLGLETVAVEADPGAIGGTDTREFMLLTPVGEDTVFMCGQCGYRANAECAEVRDCGRLEPRRTDGGYETVETPAMTTIEEVSQFLGVGPEQLVKTLLYQADGRMVAALVRGDRELNEAKLARAVGAVQLRMATAEEIREVTGAPVGFSGPVGLPEDVLIVADYEVGCCADFVVGANRPDAHLLGVNWGTDFVVDRWADLRMAVHGDPCPRCADGFLELHRAIELGHLFKLGTRYSEALGAYVDTEGSQQVPAIMGCYGLGVTRCLAAIVEAHHDDDGICWPLSVAPFEVVVLQVEPGDQASQMAAQLARELEDAGWEVLWDDRDERAGVKFKDADLIGYPLQVVVGKKALTEQFVEVRRRRDRLQRVVPIFEVKAAVQELAQEA